MRTGQSHRRRSSTVCEQTPPEKRTRIDASPKKTCVDVLNLPAFKETTHSTQWEVVNMDITGFEKAAQLQNSVAQSLSAAQITPVVSGSTQLDMCLSAFGLKASSELSVQDVRDLQYKVVAGATTNLHLVNLVPPTFDLLRGMVSGNTPEAMYVQTQYVEPDDDSVLREKQRNLGRLRKVLDQVETILESKHSSEEKLLSNLVGHVDDRVLAPMRAVVERLRVLKNRYTAYRSDAMLLQEKRYTNTQRRRVLEQLARIIDEATDVDHSMLKPIFIEAAEKTNLIDDGDEVFEKLAQVEREIFQTLSDLDLVHTSQRVAFENIQGSEKFITRLDDVRGNVTALLRKNINVMKQIDNVKFETMELLPRHCANNVKIVRPPTAVVNSYGGFPLSETDKNFLSRHADDSDELFLANWKNLKRPNTTVLAARNLPAELIFPTIVPYPFEVPLKRQKSIESYWTNLRREASDVLGTTLPVTYFKLMDKEQVREMTFELDDASREQFETTCQQTQQKIDEVSVKRRISAAWTPDHLLTGHHFLTDVLKALQEARGNYKKMRHAELDEAIAAARKTADGYRVIIDNVREEIERLDVGRENEIGRIVGKLLPS